jgi:hypothetical protein
MTAPSPAPKKKFESTIAPCFLGSRIKQVISNQK